MVSVTPTGFTIQEMTGHFLDWVHLPALEMYKQSNSSKAKEENMQTYNAKEKCTPPPPPPNSLDVLLLIE